MDDPISRQAAIDAFWKTEVEFRPSQIDEVMRILEQLPSAQPEIIRCKDCKHRPSGTGVNHDLEFPRDDYRCPCRCEDYWYSWKPADDWYCANGERRTDG